MAQNNVKMLEQIIALLQEHPEWRTTLREILFPEFEPIHELARQMQALVESQQRTDAIIRALAERQDRFEERMKEVEAQIAALVEAQRQTEATIRALVEQQQRLEERQRRLEERQQRLEERQQRLEERQQRLEERIVQLIERQERFEKRMTERYDRLEMRQDRAEERLDAIEQQLIEVTATLQQVVHTQRQMNITMGKMLGWYQEARFRERAASYLGTIGFSKVRLIPRERWVDHLEEALQKGQITKSEWKDVLDADAVVQAQRRGETVYLVIEVSHTVDQKDVERAVQRADVWKRLVSESPVVPLVAGDQITEEAARTARLENVLVVLDGRESP